MVSGGREQKARLGPWDANEPVRWPSALRPGRRAIEVLLVDDEADILESMSSILELQPGVHVTCARDGVAALAALSASRVDVMVTDFRMPTMTGCELIRKAKLRAPATAMLLMTAYGEGVLDGPDCRQAPIDGFIAKPVDPERLASLIQDLATGGHIPSGATV